MSAVRALLAAGPNHLGAAQPLPVATSDTLPPLLHTQVLRWRTRCFRIVLLLYNKVLLLFALALGRGGGGGVGLLAFKTQASTG